MPKHTKRSKTIYSVNRSNFEDYLNEYIDFIDVIKTKNGTHFLDIMGIDCGNLTETEIKDFLLKYSDVNGIDKMIQAQYDFIKKQWPNYQISKPIKSFESYCIELGLQTVTNGESTI